MTDNVGRSLEASGSTRQVSSLSSWIIKRLACILGQGFEREGTTLERLTGSLGRVQPKAMLTWMCPIVRYWG